MQNNQFVCSEVLLTQCIVCSCTFVAKKPRAGRASTICSDGCRKKRNLQHVRARYVPSSHSVKCIRCGQTFTSSKSYAQYCSGACKQSIKRQRRKARGWKRPPQDAYWALKRARKRTATVESVNPLEVFERDKWRCHLCGVKTDKKLRGKHEALSPELDHIIPLSEGGEHSYRNTACSCRSCNSRKGAKPKGQMRLFG